ncbi:nitroreductase [Pasteurellaceae bacterium Macca]|nr:nitroreductase [Pasteurellaceae bacterium Macca]
MELFETIRQRKTIKLFNQQVKISREEMAEMLALAQLAPSKANLQPWRFVVVDDTQQKQALSQLVAFNGPPCESAAAAVLILADRQYDQLLENIVQRSVETGCLHENFKARSLNFLRSLHQGLTEQDLRDQVLIDTSLSAMQLMLVAKAKGYDSHAIGVFDRDAVLELLEVDASRYLPVMLLAIGKAAVPALPSARLNLEQTVAWNSGKDLPR